MSHSLGAACNIGKAGFKQILMHAPRRTSSARKKIVIFASPNVAMNQDGDAGILYRKGLSEETKTSEEVSERPASERK